MFLFPVQVVQNWCYCNKPTACQVLVCKLLHLICSIYAEMFQQLLSLPSYHFGSMNHFFHQSWKLWINSSKEALLRSWRLTLHLISCILLIKILFNSSTTRWLVLMACVLSILVQCYIWAIYGTGNTSLPQVQEAKNDASATMAALLEALHKVLPVPPKH